MSTPISGKHRQVKETLSLDNPHDLKNKPSTLPEWAQWMVVGFFLGGALLSVWFAATAHWRRSTFTLGVFMLWLAIVRLTCDSQIVGIFAVRSRRFDTIFDIATSAAMIWLSASIDALGS